MVHEAKIQVNNSKTILSKVHLSFCFWIDHDSKTYSWTNWNTFWISPNLDSKIDECRSKRKTSQNTRKTFQKSSSTRFWNTSNDLHKIKTISHWIFCSFTTKPDILSGNFAPDIRRERCYAWRLGFYTHERSNKTQLNRQL